MSEDKTVLELRVDGRAIGEAAAGALRAFDGGAYTQRKREEAAIRAALERTGVKRG